MATRKWFGLAALVAAAGAGAAYAITKIKESPEAATNLYDDAKQGTAYTVAKIKESPEAATNLYGEVKQKAKESPERASQVIDTAKAKLKRTAEESSSEDHDSAVEVTDDEEAS